jgi:YD repeat-containing protein
MLIAVLFVLICAAYAQPASAQQWADPMNAKGRQPQRGTYSMVPWESIDMYSGNVVLTFTDFTLPGYNGMDLSLQRVLNMGGQGAEASWTIGVPGPAYVVPVLDATNQNPVITYSDGSTQNTYLESSDHPHVYMTLGFARLTKSVNESGATTGFALEMPNGFVARFDQNSGNDCFFISSLSDVYGNSLTYQYQDGPLHAVLQHLADGRERTVTFDRTDPNVWKVNWSGGGTTREWTYTWDGFVLRRVDPPAGAPWLFDYTYPAASLEDPHDLDMNGVTLTVTTPSGGVVTYESKVIWGPTGLRQNQATYERLVLRRRITSGNLPAGTWRFAYDDAVSGAGLATVADPDGLTTEFEHSVTNENTGYVPRHYLRRIDKSRGTSLLQRTMYGWDSSVNTGWGNLSFNTGPGGGQRVEVAKPLLIRSYSIQRGSLLWGGSYLYCGETGQPACGSGHPYEGGNPTSIVETGQYGRTTTLTHRYLDTPYILGRPASETVQAANESYSKTFTYDGNGFLTARSDYGITTTFTPLGIGAIDYQDDANQHRTSFTYDWGVVKNAVTPEYTIFRDINSAGTVASERRGSLQTSFDYDLLGRVVTVTPRAGAATTTSYDYDEGGRSTVTVTRDLSVTRQTLDGFDRVIESVNGLGVTTTTRYDAEGRPVFQSLPYQLAAGYPEVGTTIA